MTTDFGIDLGSQRTVICAGKSIVLDEYTAISYYKKSGELIAAGDDAYKMIGRTPDTITATCPVVNGVIAEYDYAEAMLSAFLQQVANNKLLKARVMVAVPANITEMQKRALYNACSASGVRDVCLLESPVAAAIGLGLDFTTPTGSIIVDIGSGTTDIATLVMGKIEKYYSTPIAGESFNAAIERYIKYEHNVVIGPHTTELMKKQLGCVIPRPVELTLTAKGQHQFTGMPKTFEINTSEMVTAMYDTAMSICRSIQEVLEEAQPEIVGDVKRDGITLIGCGSLLYGLPKFISDYIGVKVNTVSNPKTCVALGTSLAIKNFNELKEGGYRFKSLDDLNVQ